MNQTEKAKRFAELHVKGAPLLLYNAWDAGSAKSIVEAGAPAIATSSWAARKRRVTATARPSRSSSPSRSLRGSRRRSISRLRSISKAGTAMWTMIWLAMSHGSSIWA